MVIFCKIPRTRLVEMDIEMAKGMNKKHSVADQSESAVWEDPSCASSSSSSCGMHH